LVSGRMEDSIGIRREGFAFAEEHGQARTAGSALRLSLVEDLAEMGSWNEALGLLEGLPLADRGLNAADGLLIRWFLAIRRGDPVHLTRSLVGITQAGHPLFESYFLSVAIPIASALRDLET